MLNLELLMGVVSVGLIFILIITAAYERSISTAVYIISLAISMQLHHAGYIGLAFVVITIGALFCLGRAVVNHNHDKLIKR